MSTTWPWLSGRDDSEDLVGIFLTTWNATCFNMFRIMGMWFQPDLLENAGSIRLGQIIADSEFLIDCGDLFLNAAFAWAPLANMKISSGGAGSLMAGP